MGFLRKLIHGGSDRNYDKFANAQIEKKQKAAYYRAKEREAMKYAAERARVDVRKQPFIKRVMGDVSQGIKKSAKRKAKATKTKVIYRGRGTAGLTGKGMFDTPRGSSMTGFPKEPPKYKLTSIKMGKR